VDLLSHLAPAPAAGRYATGFAAVADRFASQLRDGEEVGAGLAIYHQGQCVVDVWGGHADLQHSTAWARDTRIVVFSVTKGLVAMALALLADRGQLDWDAPVASYWPGFGAHDKDAISVRTLVNHRAGLVGLDERISLDDCIDPARREWLTELLERQRPAWPPGTAQGYHAITFGLYVRELFERIAREPLGAYLQRELFDPLDADVSLGTPPEIDSRIATLYPPPTALRVGRMVAAAVRGGSAEGRIMRSALRRGTFARAAFLNPRLGREGIAEYNSVRVRRAELAWASATASAHGLARAYLPFASNGTAVGRSFVRPSTLAPIHARQGWSERDLVLNKPLGWSQGFLKEEPTVFSPNPESFGHAGMGGALGWCDPVTELSFGYVMNRLDWRVRSPRALALCHALYTCGPIASMTGIKTS
jgi:CubicO group peptidase (beta-lactamase class C family)